MRKAYKQDFLSSLYTTIFKIRHFEIQGVKLYRQGHIRGYFHPYWGEEAIATGVCAAMTADDYITSTHRGHGHCIAWGADLKMMFAELLGKETGYCKGLGGSMHIADYTKNNLGANGIVGSGVPIAVGAALGISIRGEKKMVCSFLSDGGSNIGSFLESLNLAATWKLPLLFVIENNQYAASTPVEQTTGETELYKRGSAFGIESIRINGNDVLEVYDTTKKFTEECKKGNGPFLMECMTYRKSGHHINDPGLYMPREMLDYYNHNDPIIISKKYLKDLAGMSDKEIKMMEDKVLSEIESAIEFGLASSEMTAENFFKLVEGY